MSEDNKICWLCGDSPCEWIRWKEDILTTAMCYKDETHGQDICNAEIRKRLYR